MRRGVRPACRLGLLPLCRQGRLGQ
jgi:hypothetical protein